MASPRRGRPRRTCPPTAAASQWHASDTGRSVDGCAATRRRRGSRDRRAWPWRCSFPKWTDGRAYSPGRAAARPRCASPARCVATGEVLVDMLPLLQRCGFDAVQLRADQNLADGAARAAASSPGHYQGDAVGRGRLARDRGAACRADHAP
ncbi:MAG: DUF934 domain-containing protein [Comamonadaceae bacterium]|nr:DUF934 domain-containing protein [Comamonadaceae bacterium]